MPTDLTAFSNPEQGIGAGIKDLYLVKKSDVESIPAAAAGVVSTDILLAVGIDMVRWDLDRSAAYFRNPAVGNGRSKGFMAEVKIKIGGTDSGMDDVISGVINGEFLAIVKLSNNLWKIVGDVDRGAILNNPEHTSGDSGEADHYNDLILTWHSEHKCYTYTGAVPVPTGV